MEVESKADTDAAQDSQEFHSLFPCTLAPALTHCRCVCKCLSISHSASHSLFIYSLFAAPRGVHTHTHSRAHFTLMACNPVLISSCTRVLLYPLLLSRAFFRHSSLPLFLSFLNHGDCERQRHQQQTRCSRRMQGRFMETREKEWERREERERKRDLVSLSPGELKKG